MPEEELVSTTTRHDREAVEAVLLDAAERIGDGEITISDDERSCSVAVPNTVELRREIERHVDPGTGRETMELEFIVSWTEEATD